MTGHDNVSPKKTNCGKCLLTDLDGEKFAESIADYISLIPDELKAPAEEYASRLNICGKCPSLTEGMCGECGCFARVRAAKIKMHCPVGQW